MIYLQDSDFTLHLGDVLDVLRELPSESVDCVITSPPYWGLRDYGPEGQLGLEPTPEQYVERMTEVFREVRRVLAAHGTCWLNMGDSYNAGTSAPRNNPDERWNAEFAGRTSHTGRNDVTGLKPKDLCGIPWRLAFALQADGWYLRSDIVWSKPNPMPESVTDRPTKAHEYVFLLTKSPRYFFDQEAVREAITSEASIARNRSTPRQTLSVGARQPGGNGQIREVECLTESGRNIRSVWEIATQPYPEAHFATFPEELVRRCLLAGCPEQVCGECGKARERVVERQRTLNGQPTSVEQARDAAGRIGPQGVGHWRFATEVETVGFTDCGHDAHHPGTVLDPFMGSGTTALVARKHSRRAVGIELNAEYCELIVKRTQQLSLLSV